LIFTGKPVEALKKCKDKWSKKGDERINSADGMPPLEAKKLAFL
jgi:hypothetical protein